MTKPEGWDDWTPEQRREYREHVWSEAHPELTTTESSRRPAREPACRHCGHKADSHHDMGCEGCETRGRECVGYEPR